MQSHDHNGIALGTPEWDAWIDEGLELDAHEGDIKWAWGDWLLRACPMYEVGKNSPSTNEVETKLLSASEDLATQGADKKSLHTMLAYRTTAHRWPDHAVRKLVRTWSVACLLNHQTDRHELVRAYQFKSNQADEFVKIRNMHGPTIPLDRYLEFKAAQEENPDLTAEDFFGETLTKVTETFGGVCLEIEQEMEPLLTEVGEASDEILLECVERFSKCLRAFETELKTRRKAGMKVVKGDRSA